MKLSLLNILSELDATGHSMERFEDRLFNSSLDTIICYKINGRRVIKPVGKFIMPGPIMSKLINSIKQVTDKSNSLVRDVTFGIFLHTFNHKELRRYTRFDDDVDIQELSDLIKYNNGFYFINDTDTKSHGNSFVAVVSDNVLITTYFTEAYTKEKLYDKLIKRSDKVVILLSPDEMEYYYDTDDRNLNALH